MPPVEHVSSDAILHHLLTKYNILAKKCESTADGLDNSVYFIYIGDQDSEPSFVFKIVETRKAIDIIQSMQVSSHLHQEFSSVCYIRTNDDSRVSHFHNKAAMVMTFVSGDHLTIKSPLETRSLAAFIGELHHGTATFSPEASPDQAELYFERARIYRSDKVLAGVAEHFPARKAFYDRIFALFEDAAIRARILSRMHKWPGTTGLAHGDLHNDNLLVTPNGGFSLIDFDSMKVNDFQLVDVLQPLARWPITSRLVDIKIFLETYLTMVHRRRTVDPHTFARALHRRLGGLGRSTSQPDLRSVRSTQTLPHVVVHETITASSPPQSAGGSGPMTTPSALINGVDLGMLQDYTDSIIHWLPVFAITAMLSIDFYAFEVGKFSPGFLEVHAAATFERLQQCIEDCIGHAGLDNNDAKVECEE